jgi:drug/metabolite transporter (DMT)-like permease
MLLLPVFSNILSYIIMGETLTTIQMVSGFVIILGVMFAQGLHKRVPQLLYWVKSRVAS